MSMTTAASPIINASWAHSRYEELLFICQDGGQVLDTRLLHVDRLLREIFFDFCKQVDIPFSNLYSRMTFVDHQYRLPNWLSSELHQYRLFRKKEGHDEAEQKIGFAMGLSALANLIAHATAQEIPSDLKNFLPEQREVLWYNPTPNNFRESLRFSAVELDLDKKELSGFVEEFPGKKWTVDAKGTLFKDLLPQLGTVVPLPVNLQLLKVEIDAERLLPKVIVLQPDYLVDISSVSECHQPQGQFPILSLLKQYLPFSPGLPLILGNIANMFLDELMMDPNESFPSLIKKIFTVQPLAIAMLSDEQVHELVQKAKIHYANLQQVVVRGFAQNRIEPGDCSLEPTFFSSDHGLQGRLDVFYPQKESPAIIELKSGKIFKPNGYGLAINHYVQTLLYDLLVKFSSKRKLKTTNYILYSGAEEKPLRFAPPAFRQQAQALHIRNQILLFEYMLAADGLRDNLLEAHCLQLLNPDHNQQLKGFHQKDLLRCHTAISRLSGLEKKYFVAYTSFIAREKMLAKIGYDDGRRSIGQSNIWRDNNREKLQRFELLHELKLVKNESGEAEPMLWFERQSQQTLSNFRKGDIAILYPEPAEGSNPLHQQLFKGTIIAIDSSRLQLRLRYKQFNTKIFGAFDRWQIEHDLLDTSYTSLQKGMFAFAEAKTPLRSLYLGLHAPELPKYQASLARPAGMTDHQFLVFGKALQAKDYFLLWGPPGTGKTNILLKNIVAHLLKYSKEKLLLLAYTNRAVDEICSAIESISDQITSQYLRIGSRYSTGTAYTDRLLQIQIEDTHTRKELLALIQSKRIIVSTVASMNAKPELFKIQQFDRVIIDEASQVLEPMLMGLLPRFKKVILIGDHQQLPAVVLQNPLEAKVRDKDLQQIGLSQLGNSLFERLFHQARKNKWVWAYDQLHEQGRLHQQLMSFTNQYFYEGCLDLIPEKITGDNRQSAQLQLFNSTQVDELSQSLSHRRKLFFATPCDPSSPSGKTNQHEAQKIKAIILAYLQIYKDRNQELTESSIGIITPYRAQIACLRESLMDLPIDEQLITIDTVERYQGGARDIILISLCTNSSRQFSQLLSASADGIDRKLNVAITRAREQLVILGNRSVLEENELYRHLIYWTESAVIEGQ